MAVKYKVTLTETTTYILIAALLVASVDVFLGFKGYREYTVKSQLTKASSWMAMGKTDAAVDALVKAKTADPLYYYTYNFLGKVLAEAELTGKNLTASAVYQEYLDIDSTYANARVGQCIATLTKFYEENPKPDKIKIKELQELLGKLVGEAAQAQADDQYNIDAQILKLYLAAEQLFIEVHYGQSSKRLRSQVKDLIRTAEETIFQKLDSGQIEIEHLPAPETLVLLYNSLGCLRVLEGDQEKETEKKLKRYDAAESYFRRAMTYRLAQAATVPNNIFLMYGRILGNPDLSAKEFETHKLQFSKALSQVKQFARKDYLELHGPAVYQALLAGARGLFQKAMTSRMMEDFANTLTMVNEAAGSFGGRDPERAFQFELQKLRVTFEMLRLEKETGQMPPLRAGEKRPINLQDLLTDTRELRGRAASQKDDVKFQFEMIFVQAAMLAKNYKEADKALQAPAFKKLKVSPEIQLFQHRILGIYYDQKAGERSGKPDDFKRHLDQSAEHYRRYLEAAIALKIPGLKDDLELVNQRLAFLDQLPR